MLAVLLKPNLYTHPFQLSLFEVTKHKFLVSSQARNNTEPYDEEKSVTENWDSNPIIACALGSSIPGWVVTHKWSLCQCLSFRGKN